MSDSVTELLKAWREAERRWELAGTPDEVRAAALDVVTAWANYQNASLLADDAEFMLAADDDGTCVAATEGASRVLGYAPDELVGKAIVDITAPATAGETPGQWARFLADGRQEGTYQLRHALGGVVEVRYQARAHHPVPGFHVSRLWPFEGTSSRGEPSKAAADRQAQLPVARR